MRAHTGGLANRSRLAVVLATVLALAGCAGSGGTEPGPTTTAPAPTAAPPTTPTPPTPPAPAAPRVVATDLDVPWGLAFLPDGSALVTLRDRGEVLHLVGGERPHPLGTVPGVAPGGEGGLLGIAVSPTFAQDGRVFVYLSAARENRVLRMHLTGETLTPDTVILGGIPRGSIHDGGRLAFGPDGYLYVTTGEAGTRTPAQDLHSLGGKILRIDQDGHPAPGNPFPGSPVWTLGHRNVQGIAWDADGRMYASEFGQDTWDELNLITPGSNYGWPVVEGRGGAPRFVDPLVQWRPAEASPSGIAVLDDAVYVAALRGQSLWRVPIHGGVAGQPERLLDGTYGRLRTVAVDPTGKLWVLTDNTFRGRPRPGDDRIVVLDPASL
ncbi:PQQ-dependent sugar dehydrogenase [Georgenia ruanii]|uniref:PQQ-dependent sugar dehydrogenase n=1 Tax=Georgenia ruanii TaxID=348442 RepID=A0A7J9UTJ5_9MICO|nr:PQQ-dependent sugar dehydrogenase [Georgenia ruanii]MPV87936.1 PQQ-dependent sugar dehydrogenase [Georgenia ruanii]